MDAFTANWNYPTQMKVGVERSKDLPDICRMVGIQAPLFVTDPGLAELPMTSALIQRCERQGHRVSLFSNIKSNPNGENVIAGVQAFRAGRHDGVIAFGGGSALDAAKAIALMVGQDRALWDFEDVGDNWLRVNAQGIAPTIAVPTTAGTGSEVGRASVITDEKSQVKRIIFHPDMLPNVVILDPNLTVGLPPHITAATGMDALSHALEALCAPFYHPMAEGIAIEAIRLVKENLPLAVAQGDHLEARMNMLVASSMGATAFQRGLGAMHALAHALGAMYDKHHGLLNAVLMPYVLKANRVAIEKPIARLANYLQLSSSDFDGFYAWVIELRQQLEIPHTFADIGLDDQLANLVGQKAYQDPSAGGNPIQFSEAEYTKLFLNALHGA
ncbi:iron-containing alcohol dehydrogenase [Algicola sagamiensis]|uniref:iron-containing alcohol dehydrogenase n=1 Tax=Algicola sagamiensis TaxID=163869 RepID=UPI00037589DA|nr:iron-containing alcohol dehydrogenase [Algicola sagamiensis]